MLTRQTSKCWYWLAFFIFTWATGPAFAAAIWLSLGTASTPVDGPDGETLTLADFSGLSVQIYDLDGNNVGDADIAGLDEAAPGHLVGVVHLGALADDGVVLKVVRDSDDRRADIGSGTALLDDFAPQIDPNQYAVDATSLLWRDNPANYQQMAAHTGMGTVTPTSISASEFDATMITAAPATGYEFVRWSGDVTDVQSGNSPLNQTLVSDRQLTAEFGAIVTSAWKLQHFGTEEVDLDDDPDNDGFSNRKEFEYGTDPLTDDDGNSDVTVDLHAGWNLLCFPMQPTPTSTMAGMFSGQILSRTLWWDPWNGSYRASDQLQGRRGYWVFATGKHLDVQVSGHTIIDGETQMYAGWNLVGVVNSKVVTHANISGLIWTWNGSAQVFQAIGAQEALQTGRAYWVPLTADTVLDLD